MTETALQFEVRSSKSGELYRLRASRTPGGVRFKCSCPAGQNGQYCRHRLDLLAGVVGELKKGSAADVETLADWARGSRLDQYISEMASLAREQDRIKNRLSEVKKEIGKLMIDGE